MICYTHAHVGHVLILLTSNLDSEMSARSVLIHLQPLIQEEEWTPWYKILLGSYEIYKPHC
jgi:hypothetical protein